jgi:hypothetical protein
MRTGHFFVEPDTSSAVNASVHVGDDQWSDIFVLNCSLELVVSAFSESIILTVVLEIALSSLIANGTVERMIG